MPRTEAMKRTFLYPPIKEINALNLEPTTSFSLMKTTLTNNAASKYTVDNIKVKKLFLFLKCPWFFNTIVNGFRFLPIFVFNISQFFKSLEFLRSFVAITICK